MRKTYAFLKKGSFGQMLSKKGYDFFYLIHGWIMFRYAKNKGYGVDEVLIVMNLNETIHPFFSIIGSANTKKKNRGMNSCFNCYGI